MSEYIKGDFSFGVTLVSIWKKKQLKWSFKAFQTLLKTNSSFFAIKKHLKKSIKSKSYCWSSFEISCMEVRLLAISFYSGMPRKNVSSAAGAGVAWALGPYSCPQRWGGCSSVTAMWSLYKRVNYNRQSSPTVCFKSESEGQMHEVFPSLK